MHTKLNILIFCDKNSSSISTVKEHLLSFQQYSRHNIFYAIGVRPEVGSEFFRYFDVIILHYSVRICLPDHIAPDIARRVSNFKGLKILFIQDEYENTYQAHDWIKKLGINVVFTCVPDQFINHVYPKQKFPNVVFINNLTGYVPKFVDINVPPLEDRQNLIVYRGRKLGYWYGALGQEKYHIGIRMKSICEARNIQVDIECDEKSRINTQSEWYTFLSSGRATLSTESGANIFDWDGTLKTSIEDYLKIDPTAGYEEIAAIFLRKDGEILMNQISPKIFQAIALKTALILYEGDYSGILSPWKHYIPLKKDWKNIEEVIKKLHDIDYLKQMIQFAHDDIIKSEKYSYQRFIKEVERVIDRYVETPAQHEFISVPLLLKRADKSIVFLNDFFKIFTSVVDYSLVSPEIKSLISVHNLAGMLCCNEFTKIKYSTPSVPGYEFNRILDTGDTKGAYAAVGSNIPLPHFIEFSFSRPISLVIVDIFWHTESRGSSYDFRYLKGATSAYSNLCFILTKINDCHHRIQFLDRIQRISNLIFTVYGAEGQQRMIIKQMLFYTQNISEECSLTSFSCWFINKFKLIIKKITSSFP